MRNFFKEWITNAVCFMIVGLLAAIAAASAFVVAVCLMYGNYVARLSAAFVMLCIIGGLVVSTKEHYDKQRKSLP